MSVVQPQEIQRSEPESSLSTRRLSVCLINPKFTPSYWGMDHALPNIPGDKRNWTVTGALPTLAALAPAHCDITLIDENVEEIDFDALESFDVIGVTGMIVQRQRMHEILNRLRKSSATVVVGGPYCSVSDAEFADLCDTRFVGEAEETWPEFLTAYAKGDLVARRYEQSAKSDMEKMPPPRYDLLKTDRYMVASLQFSRGCPFLCEFCDIITIFGRRPRVKTPQQMITEFEVIRAAGMRHCFLVDDNFIGNKQKAKELLRVVVEWQEQYEYPLIFSTEASINLADDAELLELMVKANFRSVFIGIETPRASSLQETRKVQNLRGDSMLDKLQRIRDAGLVIKAGFIVGFDGDDEGIFEEQFNFIQSSGIAQAIVAILSPIPTTPLYDRLKAEGRLDPSHPDVAFHPKQMTRETLKAGYDVLLRRLYEPDAYFSRLLDGYSRSPAFRAARKALDEHIGRKPNLAARLAGIAGGAVMALKLMRSLVGSNVLRSVGGAYLRLWRRNCRDNGAEAIPFSTFVVLCCEHWHFMTISRSERKADFGVLSTTSSPPGETRNESYLPRQTRSAA
ncbi:radical SAM protein [Rhizobium sp. JAB6]|uniref:radical SAM protein n=1 Tax=Rhizobium sp. JAB6 TaxID=2127050 RepID=UPI001FDFB66D|nr:radical SAM protein [Rhizobium sp. JAB6]